LPRVFILKNSIKEFIAFCLRFSGIPWLIRNWICRNKISIIVYHNPVPGALERHLAYLSKYYHLITLQELLNKFESKEAAGLSRARMVVTMDDGHAGNYDLINIFKKYGVKPTIYLSSHIVDTHRHFWASKVSGSKKSHARIGHEHFLSRLKTEYGFTPDQEFDRRQALNRREILEMSSWVDFQCHGKYHFSLTSCDHQTAFEEISGSKKTLEEMLGRKCDHFAFPFGDYSHREVEFLKQSGFKSGRTTDPGWNDANSDPYRLKVVAMIPDNASIHMLCAQLTGLPNYIQYFFQRMLENLKQTFLEFFLSEQNEI
jgi:peptidoglycan/xylan/chitin deacetylase (PgdA/CDA1 family)